jgi:predicted GIY-YIG superfamily endonuclease
VSKANASKGKKFMDNMWYTYVLKCDDGSFYTGHTNDLAERLSKHNAGRGPKWTACRLPVELAYQECHETKEAAIKHEKQIKKWSRSKKEALVNGDKQKLKSLSKRHRA